MIMEIEKNGANTLYKPYKAKGQCYAAPYTILQSIGGEGQPQLDNGMRCITACSFSVNNDTCLLTQKTCPPLSQNKAGFVQIWDLWAHDETSDEEFYDEDSVFTYSPVPEFSVSPDGCTLASILNNGYKMLYMVECMSVDDSPYLEPCKFTCISPSGLTQVNGRVSCCVISPDGTLAVTVSVHHQFHTHDLHTWKIMPSKTFYNITQKTCEKFLSGFHGDLYHCTFSLDGKLLCLSTTSGQVFIVKTVGLEIYSLLQINPIENTLCLCSFLPGYKLAVCMPNGMFQVWMLFPCQPECELEKKIVPSPCTIAAMKYSHDYCLVAFGTNTGEILMHCGEKYEHLYTLKCANSDIPLQVCSISFSKSCNELAVGYNDSCARIWQLPVKLNLKNICRMEILCRVPENLIDKLSIPLSLKVYLHFKAFI